MVNKSLKKTFGICAATLMIISAGGNTLTASAKRYRHHQITRKIIRKHISRYQYNKEYATYKLFKKYIRNDYKRLNSTRRALKHHKHGRLNRNLRKHERKILSNLKLHQKAANLVYKWYHHFNKKYYIFTNHKNNKIRVTVKRRRPVRKYHRHSNKITYDSVANNTNTHVSSISPRSSDISQQSLSTSTTNYSQSSQLGNDMEIAARSEYANSPYYTPSLSSAYNSYIKWFDTNVENPVGFGADNPQSWLGEQISSAASSASNTPQEISSAAWTYINTISSLYNSVSAEIQNDSNVGDVGHGVLTDKENDYAEALGVLFANSADAENYNLFNTFAYRHGDADPRKNTDNGAPILNSLKAMHSISSSTASNDAFILRNTNNYYYSTYYGYKIRDESDPYTGTYNKISLPSNFDPHQTGNGTYDNAAGARANSAFNSDIDNNDIVDAANVDFGDD